LQASCGPPHPRTRIRGCGGRARPPPTEWGTLPLEGSAPEGRRQGGGGGQAGPRSGVGPLRGPWRR
jgi:hypothetical protein